MVKVALRSTDQDEEVHTWVKSLNTSFIGPDSQFNTADDYEYGILLFLEILYEFRDDYMAGLFNVRWK